MVLATLHMSNTSKNKFCRYTTIKVDADIVSIARSAAAKNKQLMQDWVSDLINQHGSPFIGSEPINRKPSPPSRRNPRDESQ